MSWYLFFKFLHILSVIWFAGGIFARQLVRRAAQETEDIQTFANLNQAAGIMERLMVIPGSMAALILGVIVALIGSVPIFGFLQGASQNWLLVSNILLLIMIGVVPGIFLPRGKKFEPLLNAALAEGRITPELRMAMDDPVVKLAHVYEEVALVVIILLMMLKPF